MFGHFSNILLKGYEQSGTPKMSQTCSRICIEVCTQICIWIVFHNQDIHGCCLLQSSCLYRIKKARFFDFGIIMLLAHGITTNSSQGKWCTLHQWQIPHKKLALHLHIILPINTIENSARRTAPESQSTTREMILLHHTINPCFYFSHVLNKNRSK